MEATDSMSIFSVMFLVLMISSWLDTVTTLSAPTWQQQKSKRGKEKKSKWGNLKKSWLTFQPYMATHWDTAFSCTRPSNSHRTDSSMVWWGEDRGG